MPHGANRFKGDGRAGGRFTSYGGSERFSRLLCLQKLAARVDKRGRLMHDSSVMGGRAFFIVDERAF